MFSIKLTSHSKMMYYMSTSHSSPLEIFHFLMSPSGDQKGGQVVLPLIVVEAPLQALKKIEKFVKIKVFWSIKISMKGGEWVMGR